MSFHTPLRYPGGKGRLSQFMGELIEANSLTGGHYVEPYAGGAGIAITLLYLEYVSRIHLNDLNRSIYSFWRCVLDDTEALCKRITDTRPTMDEWYKQRAVQSDPNASLLDLGFSTFFLNRTNRSGIVLGGVIGGKKQTGQWKIDARYNTSDLVRRIERIASYRSRISLYNLDAAEMIRDVLPTLPRHSLVYLDPPYYVKGKGLYENHYTHADHAKIAELVSSIQQKWIVTYDNVEPIRALYSAYRQVIFGLRYSAGSRYEGKEVMVYCDGLKPVDIRPSRGTAA